MWQKTSIGYSKHGTMTAGYEKAVLIQDASKKWHLKIYDDSHLVMQLRFPAVVNEKEAMNRADEYLDDFILLRENDEFDM